MNLEKSFPEASMTEPLGTGGGTCWNHAPCAKSELQATQRVGEALENPSLDGEIHVGILEEINREVTYWGGVPNLDDDWPAWMYEEGQWFSVFASEAALIEAFKPSRVDEIAEKSLDLWMASVRLCGDPGLILRSASGVEIERWAV